MSQTDEDRIPKELRHRVPTGQTLSKKWPVLHYSGVPIFTDMSKWQFRTFGRPTTCSAELARFRAYRVFDAQLTSTASPRGAVSTTPGKVLFSTLAERAQVRQGPGTRCCIASMGTTPMSPSLG